MENNTYDFKKDYQYLKNLVHKLLKDFNDKDSDDINDNNVNSNNVASLIKTKVLPLDIDYTLDFTSLNCFGDIVFKSGDLWEKTTSGIIAPTDGYYQMSLSIVTFSEVERVTTAVAFTLNGDVIPGESSNAYIRSTSLINTASSTLTNVQYFNAGDVIGVATKRTDNVAGVKATIVEENSMLSVVKLSA